MEEGTSFPDFIKRYLSPIPSGNQPKRFKYDEDEPEVSSTCTDQPDDVVRPFTTDSWTLQLYNLIDTLGTAYEQHKYSRAKTKNLVIKKCLSYLPPCVPPTNPEVASSTSDTMDGKKVWLWNQWACYLEDNMTELVEFAKWIPGFTNLTPADQLALLKYGFFEMWLAGVARLVSDITCTFFDGTYATRQQVEIIYDVDFATCLFHFANSFNTLSLDDTEVGLFLGIILLSSHRPNVTHPGVVASMQVSILKALKLKFARTRTDGEDILTRLLLNLYQLRSLGLEHYDRLQWFRNNWRMLRTPTLIAETFNIPKREASWIQY